MCKNGTKKYEVFRRRVKEYQAVWLKSFIDRMLRNISDSGGRSGFSIKTTDYIIY